MFKSDESFCARWMAILNKCSYDLMLLVIEQSMAVVENTTGEIETLTENLKGKTETNEFDDKRKQLTSELESLEKKLKDTKIRKLERDKNDYKTKRVYNWTFNKLTQKKKVTWGESTYSDFETTDEGEDSASTSADESSFQRKPPQRATKQRARDAFLGMRPPRRGKIIFNLSSRRLSSTEERY